MVTSLVDETVKFGVLVLQNLGLCSEEGSGLSRWNHSTFFLIFHHSKHPAFSFLSLHPIAPISIHISICMYVRIDTASFFSISVITKPYACLFHRTASSFFSLSTLTFPFIYLYVCLFLSLSIYLHCVKLHHNQATSALPIRKSGVVDFEAVKSTGTLIL